MKSRRTIFIFICFFSFLIYFLFILFEKKFSFSSHKVLSLYFGQAKQAFLFLPFVLLSIKVILHLRLDSALENLLKKISNTYKLFFLFTFYFIITLSICGFAYYFLPQADAVGVYFQTKIFQLGRLWVQAPIIPDAFGVRGITVYQDKWFSFYQPIHSFFLLIGNILKIPWLIGPIFGFLTLLLTYRLAKGIFGTKVGLWVLILGCTSPFFLFISASYDFHNSSLLFTTLILYALWKLDDSKQLLGIFIGVLCGFLLLVRPFNLILIAGLVFAYLLLRKHLKLLPFIVIGFIPFIIFQLYYNKSLTGNLLLFPYQLLPEQHGIGFTPDVGFPTFGIRGHGVLKLVINTGYQLIVLSQNLFGWLFFSLLFIPFGIRRNASPALVFWNRFLISIPVGLFLLYCFYWFHGITPFGPKYLSEAIPALIILTALGVEKFPFDRRLRNTLIIVFIIYTYLLYIPYHVKYIRKGNWGETPRVKNIVSRYKLKEGLIFIKPDSNNMFNYSQAFNYNDPLLKNSIIYVQDINEVQNRFLSQYFKKESYLLDVNKGTLTPLIFRNTSESPRQH